MKPDTHQAMTEMISEIRHRLPFDMPVDQLCSGICNGCSKKLLDFLDIQLEEWEMRLQAGESPALGEINQLAKTARKIHTVIERNGLLG